MRWDGLTGDEDAEGQGELLATGSIPGLVRSVTTPEFAGMTFHEVRARSVLNAVPAGSAMPFRWTVNPYRGCSHACVYCLGGDTLVLMADGSQRPIADLRPGDQVVGTERRSTYRHYVSTEVLAHWSTVKPAHRVRLQDGTELVASGDHRFLTGRGWKHVADAHRGQRPHLTTNDELLGRGSGAACAVAGTPVTGGAHLRVTSVEALGVEIPMYDITTGTGDFVANGVVSHNCYARGSHAWLDLDTGAGFDSEVVVKVNAAERVAAEVSRPAWGREHVALGTNTDPYQRAEGRYRLMPGIIEALRGSGTPFSVLTKGTLLRRDLPLLTAASRDVPIGLGVSVAVWDDALHRAIEPGAPSARARLDLVRAVREAGLPCGVFMAPVLPGLTDSAEQLDAALAALAGAGATGVTVLPLHLRPGAREWWLTWLARERPDLLPLYRELYGRGAYVPRAYRDALAARVTPLLERHGLAGRRGGEQRGVRPDEGDFPTGSLPDGTAPRARPASARPEDGTAQLSLL